MVSSGYHIMSVAEDSDTGYVLVADLEIEGYHDIFDQFPMCPENVEIGEDQVSQYTRELAAACNMKLRPTKKLCLSLSAKHATQPTTGHCKATSATALF